MLFTFIEKQLRDHGFIITEVKGINHGRQIKLMEGAVINIYTNNKVLVQGKSIFDEPEQLKEKLEAALPKRSTVWQLS